MRSLCLLLVTSAALAEPPRPPDGFRALFNGEDLNGWYGHNPHQTVTLSGDQKQAAVDAQQDDFTRHWTVEDGELVNDGRGPYAATDEDFGDIDLRLEYRTVPGADSGVYLRGTPQVQIWDWKREVDPAGSVRPDWGSGGLFNNTPGTLGRDPVRFADRPHGQWNKLGVRQIGGRTWVWLNGQPVVEGAVMENYWDRSRPLPATGPIMLQTHGGEIRWRNVFVKELKDGEKRTWLAAHPPLPEPTVYDAKYGPHRKNVLHFWKAESEGPTPVLLFVHGGSWLSGGRLTGLSGGLLQRMLDNGVSVASVEYRFIPEAAAGGVVPPVAGPLHDAARALQFVRSKAEEWGLDKERVAAAGTSAGACSSLWLAFHDDLADPEADDPVARESTRPLTVAAVRGQTTLDPEQMRSWIPNITYGGHAFGKRSFAEFLDGRGEIADWIEEFSPYALLTPDDPPVYLYYTTKPGLPSPERDATHSANFGVGLRERCAAAGVACELVHPGVADPEHATPGDYLIEALTR